MAEGWLYSSVSSCADMVVGVLWRTNWAAVLARGEKAGELLKTGFDDAMGSSMFCRDVPAINLADTGWRITLHGPGNGYKSGQPRRSDDDRTADEQHERPGAVLNFAQYGSGALVLLISGAVVIGSAWLARFIAVARPVQSDSPASIG